jgi:hypothetical protein
VVRLLLSQKELQAKWLNVVKKHRKMHFSDLNKETETRGEAMSRVFGTSF